MKKLSAWIKEINYKKYVCINVGMLIIGIFMMALEMHNSMQDSPQSSTRGIIGAVYIAFWLVLFSGIDRDRIDKMIIRLLGCAVALGVLAGTLIYFLEWTPNIGWDIVWSMVDVVVVAYLVSVFVDVVKIFMLLLDKAEKVFLPEFSSTTLGAMKIIKAIVAGMATVGAFGTNFVAAMKLVRCIVSIL